jgi:hypothetical protein
MWLPFATVTALNRFPRLIVMWRRSGVLTRMKVAVLTFGVALCSGWVGMHATEMAPVRTGTSADLWKHACQVDIIGQFKGREESWGSHGCNIYPPQGKWYVYYDQHFHGQQMYRVAAAEADADLAKVIKAIEAIDDPDLQWVRAGFTVWRQRPVEEQTAAALQLAMRTARIDEIAAESPKSGRSLRSDDLEFPYLWRRFQRYWLTVAFEMAWLSALVIFTGYPWLRGSGTFRWATHLGLLPLLLYLPMYLGYAPLTFTSAYPIGGVVYPFALRLAAWPVEEILPEWTEPEIALVSSPKLAILGPISQPSGPMISLSGSGAVSPLGSLLYGLILAGIWVVPALYWKLLVYRLRSAYADGATRG